MLIQTAKSDSFGRWLARVWVDGECFNEAIVAAGHATAYRTGEGGV